MRKNIAIAACAALLAALAYFILNPTAQPIAPAPLAPTPTCAPCAPCGQSSYAPRCLPPTAAPVTYAVPPTQMPYCRTNAYYCQPTAAPIYPDGQQIDPSSVSLPLPDGVNEVALPDSIKANMVAQQGIRLQSARVVLVTSDSLRLNMFSQYVEQLTESGWTSANTYPETYAVSQARFYKQGVMLRVIIADVAQWQQVSGMIVSSTYGSDVYKLIAGKKTVMLVVKGIGA